MSQAEYVAAGAGRCPFCRSVEITLFRSDQEEGMVDEEFECALCGRMFHRLLRAQGWKAGP